MTDNVIVSNTPLTDYSVATHTIDAKQHQLAIIEFGYPDIGDVSVPNDASPLPTKTNARFLYAGSITITSSAVPQRLLGSWHQKVNGKVDLRANKTNTGIICIGNDSVNATSTPPVGVWLEAGEAYSFEMEDLYNVYVAAEVNGEGASFTTYSNMVQSLS
jgi:hypothetical protein